MKTRFENIKKAFNDFELALINNTDRDSKILVESEQLQADYERRKGLQEYLEVIVYKYGRHHGRSYILRFEFMRTKTLMNKS